MDGHVPHGQGEVDILPGQFIGFDAVDVDGGIFRRRLFDVACKRRQDTAHVISRQIRYGRRLDDGPRTVFRIRRQAQGKFGMVRFDVAVTVFNEARRLTSIDGQDPRRQGIQGTGMAHLLHTVNTAQAADDVMTGHTRRFQYIDDSVYHKRFSISFTMSFFASSSGLSRVQPAARTWPPPPKTAATALTSMPFERRLTRVSLSLTYLTVKATSDPLTLRA